MSRTLTTFNTFNNFRLRITFQTIRNPASHVRNDSTYMYLVPIATDQAPFLGVCVRVQTIVAVVAVPWFRQGRAHSTYTAAVTSQGTYRSRTWTHRDLVFSLRRLAFRFLPLHHNEDTRLAFHGAPSWRGITRMMI